MRQTRFATGEGGRSVRDYFHLAGLWTDRSAYVLPYLVICASAEQQYCSFPDLCITFVSVCPDTSFMNL